MREYVVRVAVERPVARPPTTIDGRGRSRRERHAVGGGAAASEEREEKCYSDHARESMAQRGNLVQYTGEIGYYG